MATDIIKTENKGLNNLLDELFSTGSGWNKPEIKFPPVNITEGNENFEVDLYAPGLEKNDFKVNLENGLLTISYDKKVENKDKKAHRIEYMQSSFSRSFTIDDANVDAAKIHATYKDGVLKLTLPKKEKTEIAPKQIEVK